MMSLEVLLPETMFLGLALKCQSSNCSKIWWASKYKYCHLPSQLNKPNMLFLSLLAFKFHQEWIDKCESCFSSSFVAFKMNALYLFLIPLHIYKCTVPFSSFFSLKKKELNGWQFLFFFFQGDVCIYAQMVFLGAWIFCPNFYWVQSCTESHSVSAITFWKSAVWYC